MLYPTREILSIKTDTISRRLTMTDPVVCRAFLAHCEDELANENTEFVCALAPFRQDMPAYRSNSKSYLPRNEARRWSNPQLAGVIEHFVLTSAPRQINISFGVRNRLIELYNEQDLLTGVVAPNLNIGAFDPALNEVLVMLDGNVGRFRDRVAALQKEMKSGAEQLSSKAQYAIALVEERKHQAGKLKAARAGTFLFMPFCADAKPLLQVSSGIGRGITMDRFKMAKQLGLALEGKTPITGTWVRMEDGTYRVCGRPSDKDAADAFRLGLPTIGGGNAVVIAATEQEVRTAADPTALEKSSAKVRKAGKTVADAAGKAARLGGKKHASAVMKVMSRNPSVGAVDAGTAIADGLKFMEQNRYAALANALKSRVNGNAVATGVKKMAAQGTGSYWLCVYDDPDYSGGKFKIVEAWLYRGSSPPRNGEDPLPRMKPNTQWFCLVTTRQAMADAVVNNLKGSGLM